MYMMLAQSAHAENTKSCKKCLIVNSTLAGHRAAEQELNHCTATEIQRNSNIPGRLLQLPSQLNN